MIGKLYRPDVIRPVVQFALNQSYLGGVLVAKSEHGLRAILLGDDPAELVRDLQRRFPNESLSGSDPELAELVDLVLRFLEAPWGCLEYPLDIRGTPFQQRVRHALQEIPSGQTSTYTEIAQRIAAPKSARAVGQACAANPLAVCIPCHRVLRSNGDLSGFHWGVDRKRLLLELEASHEQAKSQGSARPNDAYTALAMMSR